MTIQDSNLYREYNFAIARDLLGPADYLPGEQNSCLDSICNVITHIWISFKRMLNYIFGDHRWHNNLTAYNMIYNYCYENIYAVPMETRSPEHAQITDLYQALRFRAYHSPGDNICSWGELLERSTHDGRRLINVLEPSCQETNDHPNQREHVSARSHQEAVPSSTSIPAYPQILRHGLRSDIPVLRPEAQDLLNPRQPQNTQSVQSSLQAIHRAIHNVIREPSQARRERTAQNEERLVNQFFNKGETGNIILRKSLRSLSRQGDDPTTIQQTLQVMQESLQNHSYLLDEVENATNETYSKMYQDLCNIYGEREFNYRTENEHTEEVISEKNAFYANAQDPTDLFGRALCDACRELHSDPVRHRDPAPTFRTNGYLLMMLNLLLQADVKADDCAGPYVQFNNYIKVRYQKPILIFAQEGTEMVPQVVFNTDCISSTFCGCDPEGARRILKSLEDQNLIGAFKDYLFENVPPAHASMPLLKKLMLQMNAAIEAHYSTTIIDMKCNRLYYQGTSEARNHPELTIPDLKSATFKTYTRNAETIYEYMSRAATWMAQKYANKGLLNEDDISSEAYTYLTKLISSNAIFEMLKNTMRINDFQLSLNENITFGVGKFFSFEPTLEDARQLSAHERFIPHMFGGSGSTNDPASDPIKAKALMQKLTQEEQVFAERYILSVPLLNLYEVKGIADEQTLNSLRDIREELAQMDPEKQHIIRDLHTEILKMQEHFAEAHFNDLFLLILDTIAIPENASPIAISFAQPAPEAPLVYQEILWEYLPADTDRNKIACKNPPRNAGTSVKVSWRNYRGHRDAALRAQNRVLENPARCGNCMYGALAIEIFGLNPHRDSSMIEHYAGVLRQTAANFILRNPDNFLHAMSDPTNDHQHPGETNEDFAQRMQPILRERLQNYCRKVRDNQRSNLEWGTATEMSAISSVFGVPIHVFYINRPMDIGTEGIDEGVILPNTMIGSNFAGAPLRYMYTGNHYKPIRLITA